MPRTALVPTIALGCLALFLVLSAWSAQMATDHLAGDGDPDGSPTTQRAGGYMTWYDVDGGDEVVLRGGASSANEAALPYARVLVLEGGEAQDLFPSGQPEHILYETRFQQVADGRFAGEFRWFEERFRRPAIYDGKPHGEGGNGDFHDAIDVVVLVDRPSGMADAQWAKVSAAASRISIAVTVARQPWVDLQYAWYTGMALSLGAALIGLAGLARPRPTSDVDVDDSGPGIGGLVALHGRAAAFLRSLRATLLVAGALLAFGGLAALGGLNALTEAGRYDPFETWLFLVMGLGWGVYVLSLVVWGIQYRRISREVKRWQTTPSPLDA